MLFSQPVTLPHKHSRLLALRLRITCAISGGIASGLDLVGTYAIHLHTRISALHRVFGANEQPGDNLMLRGPGVRGTPAHAGSLSPWERLVFALAFALMAAFVGIGTGSAARLHEDRSRERQ